MWREDSKVDFKHVYSRWQVHIQCRVYSTYGTYMVYTAYMALACVYGTSYYISLLKQKMETQKNKACENKAYEMKSFFL